MRLVSRTESHRLSATRLRDAELLLRRKRWSGAYYLSGLAVECAPKAAISRQFRRNAIPDKKFILDIYVHNLTDLRRLADLDRAFILDCETISGLEASWATVKDWNEQARYAEWSRNEAQDLVNAVNDPSNGVLIWLHKYY